LVSLSSGQYIEKQRIYDPLAPSCQTRRRNNPQYHNMKLHICENLALCTHIELLASINSSNFLNKKLSRKARVAHHWSATEITSNGTPYEPKDKLNYTNV